MNRIKKFYQKKKMWIWIALIIAIIFVIIYANVSTFSIYGNYWTNKPF